MITSHFYRQMHSSGTSSCVQACKSKVAVSQRLLKAQALQVLH